MNRIPKAILERMGIESALKYSTKDFRRGAAMDIMASGSALAQIMRSAGWHSQAFRAYLIFQMEEERNIKAIFASSNRSKPAHPGDKKKKTRIAASKRPPSPLLITSSEDDSTSSSPSNTGGAV